MDAAEKADAKATAKMDAADCRFKINSFVKKADAKATADAKAKADASRAKTEADAKAQKRMGIKRAKKRAKLLGKHAKHLPPGEEAGLVEGWLSDGSSDEDGEKAAADAITKAEEAAADATEADKAAAAAKTKAEKAAADATKADKAAAAAKTKADKLKADADMAIARHNYMTGQTSG